jgi:hypothetical protein
MCRCVESTEFTGWWTAAVGVWILDRALLSVDTPFLCVGEGKNAFPCALPGRSSGRSGSQGPL